MGLSLCRELPIKTSVRAGYAIGGMLIAAVLLALPAGAAAKPGGHPRGLAARQCAQERSQLGRKAFRKKYGAKHTMRSCTRRTRPQVASVLDSAVQGCQAELAQSGAETFIDDYVDDLTGTVDEAMAECVAETVDELLNPEDYTDPELDDE